MKRIICNYFFIAFIATALVSGCDSASPEKAIKRESESERLRKNGNALIEIGNTEEAVNVFDQLIKLEPKNIVAYNGKAIAFDRSGNHLAAQEIYKAALSINPNSVLTKSNLGMSFILNNQLKQSIGVLEPLAKNDKYKKSPYLGTIRHNLALAYALSDQSKKAKDAGLEVINKKSAEEEVASYKKSGKSTERDEKETTKSADNVGFVTTSPPPPVKRPYTPPSTVKKNTEANKIISKAKKNEKEKFLGITAVYSYPQ